MERGSFSRVLLHLNVLWGLTAAARQQHMPCHRQNLEDRPPAKFDVLARLSRGPKRRVRLGYVLKHPLVFASQQAEDLTEDFLLADAFIVGRHQLYESVVWHGGNRVVPERALPVEG